MIGAAAVAQTAGVLRVRPSGAPGSDVRRADDVHRVVSLPRVRVTRAKLTPRQRAVLRGLLAGGTYRQIAIDLGVAPSTIRKHVEDVYRRVGVQSRAQLFSTPGIRRIAEDDLRTSSEGEAV